MHYTYASQRAPAITSTCLIVLALSMSLAAPASAAIIGGAIISGGAGAAFVKLTPPLGNPFGPANSVGNDTFQSPNLFGFDEDQNIVLAAPLTVSIRAGGGPLILPAGMTVASRYVFFDPTSGSVDGTVDFDFDISAIITSTSLLLASDFLANTGVNYLNPGARGLEPEDAVFISGVRQIRLDAIASSPGDYIRVLTAYSPLGAVPEPGTASLLGAALGLVAVGRAYRNAKRG